MRYYSIIKYIDETARNFHQYDLPILPVPPPETTATVNSTKYKTTDVLDWTQVFEDTNYPPIPILPIPFEGDQEEFDVDIPPVELEELKDDDEVEAVCLQKRSKEKEENQYNVTWVERKRAYPNMWWP